MPIPSSLRETTAAPADGQDRAEKDRPERAQRSARRPAGGLASRAWHRRGSQPEDGPPTGGIGFFELGPGRCRMPLWRDGQDPPLAQKRFCGAPAAGCSWCEACAGLVYAPQQPTDDIEALLADIRPRR